MSARRFREYHDPDAVLDYSIDWSRWIADGDSIGSSEWAATPAGLTISADNIAGAITTARVSGGAAGATYVLTNHVVLASGQEDDRSIELICVER